MIKFLKEVCEFVALQILVIMGGIVIWMLAALMM